MPDAPAELRKLGDISYGIYLIHWPVVNVASWLAHHKAPSPEIGEIWRWCTIASAIVLAALSWSLLERPLMRLVRGRNTTAGPSRGPPRGGEDWQPCHPMQRKLLQ